MPMSPELEEDAVPAARVLPQHVLMLCADHATRAALETTVGDERDLSVAFLRVAGGRATHRARLGLALHLAHLGICDLDMRPPAIHLVAVLKELLFDLDHSNALQSLNASP